MGLQEQIETLDKNIIDFFGRIYLTAARVALFVVYFWFGFLKWFDVSPANPLVSDLLAKTLPFISFQHFILVLGTAEMMIGLAFLIPKLERIGLVLLVIHMFTTFMPLILLPAVTWQHWFVPTLEGQYIIKNLLIIALAIVIVSRIQPLVSRKNK